MVTIVFYIIPFLILVALPAWLIPFLVCKIINRKKQNIPSFLPFVLTMIGLAFLTNVLWEFFLFNKIYYEWDRVFLPYTFFSHESPLLDGSSSWIAKGWKVWYLDALWFIITMIIYAVSARVSLHKNRNSPQINLYKKIIISSLITLIILSISIPQLLPLLFKKIWTLPSNLTYKEVNTACRHSPTSGQKIFYTADQTEWISDINGTHLHQAFEKHLQLKGSSGAISPDSTMAAVVWDHDIWVYCLYSNGAFKIPLPRFGKDVGFQQMRSSPSWSPDSKYIIMDNNGDLLLIDVTNKSTRVLKRKVALKDNQIDITSKDHKLSPPYEVGTAYWDKRNTILYTAFSKNNTTLHALDGVTASDSLQDTILRESKYRIDVDSVDHSGTWALISESSWAGDWEHPHYFRYFYNIKTKQTIQFNQTDNHEVVWSPSTGIAAFSSSSYNSSPKLAEIPAVVENIESKQAINITDMVKQVLRNRHIKIEDKATVVEVKDFLDDSRILIKVILESPSIGIPYQLNGILNIHSGEFTILQEYKEGSQPTSSHERLNPLQIIK